MAFTCLKSKVISSNRLAGNASYIIGTLAESEGYRHDIINLLLTSSKSTVKNALKNLTSMMLAEDDETIINAAGTLGTLVIILVIKS